MKERRWADECKKKVYLVPDLGPALGHPNCESKILNHWSVWMAYGLPMDESYNKLHFKYNI